MLITAPHLWLCCLFLRMSSNNGARAIRRHAKTAPRFDQSRYMATHNSYEIGQVGIVGQLDLGVRNIEFDIWTNGYESVGDWRIGHLWPGEAVKKGVAGNPNTDKLGPWMDQIAQWSRRNSDHSPLTVTLDMKSDFAAGGKLARQGNFAQLQSVMQATFGDALYWSQSQFAAGWPSVDALRGKVLLLLSGDENSRAHYRRDIGANPSIAINSLNETVEVHANSDNTKIYYWTGVRTTEGVEWKNHGFYDTGKDASVAIHNDVVVEVHASTSRRRTKLWYRVGKLNSDLDVEWGPSNRYDSGVNPTVRLTDSGNVNERHKSQSTGKVWERTGTVNVGGKTISWHSDAKQRNVALHGRTESRGVSVRASGKVLQYSMQGYGWRSITYSQMFFVERQPGCSHNEEDYWPINEAVYVGVSHKCDVPDWDGKLVRHWQYELTDFKSGKATGNYPSTDYPSEEYLNTVVLSSPEGIAF